VGNVLQFPTDRIKYPERVFKDETTIIKTNDDHIRQLQHMHVSETIENVVPIIFRYLASAGFDLSTINNVKEGAFIVEALRSALLQLYNINHPFQKLSEEIFENIDPDENILKIVTKINIELEPEEEILEIEG